MIHTLGEQIGTKLAKAEEEGAKGDVAGSLKFLEEVEDLKKRKTTEEVGHIIACSDCHKILRW